MTDGVKTLAIIGGGCVVGLLAGLLMRMAGCS